MPNLKNIHWQQKRNFIFIAVGVVVLIVLSSYLSSKEKKEVEITPSSVKTITLNTPVIDNSAVWLHRAEHALHQEQLDIETVKGAVDKLTQAAKENLISQEKIIRLEQKIESLQQEVKTRTSAVNFSVPVSTDGKPLQKLPSSNDPLLAASPTMMQSIKNDELLLSPSAESNSSEKNAETYVPSGTFVKAVLLSGLDASAGVASQTQPRPVILRMTDEGTLPNHLHSHLKNCFVTGAGYGDISSERVYIRLERLSCARKNKSILDIPVYGYVSGPDGKAGVRGTTVWRENTLLQRSFVSGLFSGLGQGLANSYTQTSLTPLGATQNIDGSNLLKSGMTTGASTALGKLADYNIRRAEQYQPIIQVSSTEVNVIFHTGFFLENGNENIPGTASSSQTSLPSPSGQ